MNKEITFKPLQLVLLCLSLLITLVNVIILCVICPRQQCVSQDLSFDYMGVIVAIFSVLVTALLCWNVYTVIDIKNISNNVKQVSDDVNKVSEKYKNDTQALARILSDESKNNGQVFSVLEYEFHKLYMCLSGKDQLSLYYHILYHGLRSISWAMSNNNVDDSVKTTQELIDVIDSSNEIMITSNQKVTLLSIISNEDADKIPNFNVLKQKITSLKTNN